MSGNKKLWIRTPNIDGESVSIDDFPVSCMSVNGNVFIKSKDNRLIIGKTRDWEDAERVIKRINSFQNGEKSIYSLLSVVIDCFRVYKNWNRSILTGNPQAALYEFDEEKPIFIDAPIVYKYYQYMGKSEYCLFYNGERIFWASRGWQVEEWPQKVNSYLKNEIDILPYVLTLGRIVELETEPRLMDIIKDVKEGENITDYVFDRWGKKKNERER